MNWEDVYKNTKNFSFGPWIVQDVKGTHLGHGEEGNKQGNEGEEQERNLVDLPYLEFLKNSAGGRMPDASLQRAMLKATNMMMENSMKLSLGRMEEGMMEMKEEMKEEMGELIEKSTMLLLERMKEIKGVERGLERQRKNKTAYLKTPSSD